MATKYLSNVPAHVGDEVPETSATPRQDWPDVSREECMGSFGRAFGKRQNRHGEFNNLMQLTPEDKHELSSALSNLPHIRQEGSTIKVSAREKKGDAERARLYSSPRTKRQERASQKLQEEVAEQVKLGLMKGEIMHREFPILLRQHGDKLWTGTMTDEGGGKAHLRLTKSEPDGEDAATKELQGIMDQIELEEDPQRRMLLQLKLQSRKRALAKGGLGLTVQRASRAASGRLSNSTQPGIGTQFGLRMQYLKNKPKPFINIPLYAKKERPKTPVVMATCRVLVTVVRGANLPALDVGLTGMTSDPFVKVHHGVLVRETSVKKRNLNPKWNETLVFLYKTYEDFNMAGSMVVEVFDKDHSLKANDLMGKALMDPSEMQIGDSDDFACELISGRVPDPETEEKATKKKKGFFGLGRKKNKDKYAQVKAKGEIFIKVRVQETNEPLKNNAKYDKKAVSAKLSRSLFTRSKKAPKKKQKQTRKLSEYEQRQLESKQKFKALLKDRPLSRTTPAKPGNFIDRHNNGPVGTHMQDPPILRLARALGARGMARGGISYGDIKTELIRQYSAKEYYEHKKTIVKSLQKEGVKVKIIKKRVVAKQFEVKRAKRAGTGYVKAAAYDPYASGQEYPAAGTPEEQARAQEYLRSTAAAAAGPPPGTAYTQMTAGTDWSEIDYEEGVNSGVMYEKMTFE